ncbi:MAG TPA: FAD-binding oxidoreductase [Woeseiaceae bacterium]|nr:FAD-binding oxidoreductase [Woeseiaceae bacterium]
MRPVVPPADIPSAADVVIIGGGIIGISTAWFLARQGVDVVVCEKGHVAGEQSGRNWGWVRQQGRDLRELPLAIAANRIWRGLEAEIGESVGFTQGGCLFAARTESGLAGYEDWAAGARGYDLDTEIVRGEKLDALARGAGLRWAGAMYTASDGRAEPHKAVPALARAVAREGGTVLTGTAVRGIDIAAGRTAGVVTEHGRIRAPTVLCAGGAWTSLFCRSVGVELPQLKVRGTVARTAPGPHVLDGNLFDERIGIRRREDGGYTVAPGALLDHAITPASFRHFFRFLPALRQDWRIVHLSVGREFLDEWRTPVHWSLDAASPFEATRVLDPAPNAAALRTLRRDLATVFPALTGIAFVETWAGMIESTPDVIPVMDATAVPGFYVATGFSGHGFGIGPGAGMALAALVTGGDAGIDLHELRLGRFFDGSRICPQSSI